MLNESYSRLKNVLLQIRLKNDNFGFWQSCTGYTIFFMMKYCFYTFI